jgi:zinc-ribbon domain
MTTCASCGKEIRDDDWTCGHCGAPVTGAGAAAGNEEQAGQARAAFESVIKDFRLVFTLQDPTHLEMKVEGTPVGGSAVAQDSRSSVVLVKDD